jgi:hypothetical protein
MSGGVFGDRTGRVRRHVLEDPAQPLDDVVIINFIVGIRDASSSLVY